MAFVDYYKILGVDKNIPQKDVRAAYRKRAKQYHPDLHPDDERAKIKFQALNEAYDVISDPEKRAKYDKYGEQWKQASAYEQAGGGFGGFGGGQGAGGNPFEGFDFSSFNKGGSGFSSFFENLFGAGQRSGFGQGAYQGGGCQGGGCGQHAQPDNGEVNLNVNIDLYTALLGGEGIVKLNDGSKIKLKIKEGTQNGTKVKVRGKGNAKADGSKGDLIITYNVKLPEGLNDKQKDLLRQMKEAQN